MVKTGSRAESPLVWNELEVEHGGRMLSGSYAYNPRDKVVEVRNVKGRRKAARIGNLPAKTLARLMLIELANEGKV
jgi:hypothetical protein